MIMQPTSAAFHVGSDCHKFARLAESMGEFDFTLCLAGFAGDQANLCKASGNLKVAATWQALADNAEKLARACP